MSLSDSGPRCWAPRAVLRIGLLACISASILTLPAAAGDRRGATTSRIAQGHAVRAIPLKQLDREDQRCVVGVLNDVSIYRRLPTQVIDCDPRLLHFLIVHPEVVTNIWSAMGISLVSARPLENGRVEIQDGQGTTGTVRVVQEAADQIVIYGEGEYSGKFVRKPVQAQCVLMLRTRTIRETDGRHYITCVLDVFVHFDQGGVELIARAVHPLIGRIADRNFAETMGFVSSLSRTAEINPHGTAQLASRLVGVDPEVRAQLTRLARDMSQTSTIAGNDDSSGELRVPTLTRFTETLPE